MPQKQQSDSNPYGILGQTEVTEGDSKVVITEYNNGARSYRNIRPKRPFYKHIWFYFLIILTLFILLAIERY